MSSTKQRISHTEDHWHRQTLRLEPETVDALESLDLGKRKVAVFMRTAIRDGIAKERRKRAKTPKKGP